MICEVAALQSLDGAITNEGRSGDAMDGFYGGHSERESVDSWVIYGEWMCMVNIWLIYVDIIYTWLI